MMAPARDRHRALPNMAVIATTRLPPRPHPARCARTSSASATRARRTLTLLRRRILLQAALDLADLGFLEDQAIETNGAHAGIGLLTALDRDEWAAERERLKESAVNAAR